MQGVEAEEAEERFANGGNKGQKHEASKVWETEARCRRKNGLEAVGAEARLKSSGMILEYNKTEARCIS